MKNFKIVEASFLCRKKDIPEDDNQKQYFGAELSRENIKHPDKSYITTISRLES